MFNIINKPFYLIIGFLIFHYFIAEPVFGFDLIRSILAFVVFYLIYINYGDKIFESLSKAFKK